MDFAEIDISDAADVTTFEPLPPGWYKVIIDDVADCETKSGTGRYLKTRLQVIEGERKGRTVFANFNYLNDSAKAQAIGKGQLKALVEACGKTWGQVRKPEELKSIPFLAKFSVDPGNGNFAPQNRLQGTKALPKQEAPAAPIKRTELKDDDIPF